MDRALLITSFGHIERHGFDKGRPAEYRTGHA